MRIRLLLFAVFVSLAAAYKPIPRVQAIPLPYDQVSFQREEKEIARLHFSPDLIRPFVYPLIGPSGRSLTRMGHPGDPHTHSHHNSVWFSLSNVNGVDFWADHGGGRIRHQYTELLEDGDKGAFAVTRSEWLGESGKPLLREFRHTAVKMHEGGEWMLVLELTLEAPETPVLIAKGSFGPIGVRMAKWIGVHHGGGTVRNSEGESGEESVFRKPARWVDYSGQVAPGIVEGLTLMDHPSNPRHPQPFHVREDGWMGAMLALDEPYTIRTEEPLRLRYAVYVHSGLPSLPQLDAVWNRFAAEPLRPSFGPPRAQGDCMHGDHHRYTVPRRFESQRQCEDFVRGRQ